MGKSVTIMRAPITRRFVDKDREVPFVTVHPGGVIELWPRRGRHEFITAEGAYAYAQRVRVGREAPAKIKRRR